MSKSSADQSGRRSAVRRFAAALLLSILPLSATAQETARDADSAIKVSQAAIGTQVGDYVFTGSDGKPLALRDLRGAPVALHFIYTACADTCPTIVETLADAADDGWKALGKGSFKVVTIGFNTPADTSDAMRIFAAQRGVKNRDWHFLSGDPVSVAGLAQDTGFVFFDSLKGFDHLAQVTLIDKEGVVRAQVYGDYFDLPRFMEPMKALVLGGPVRGFDGLWDRVRLFCTIYDARSGKYYFDYSFFVMIFAGVTVLAPVAWFLWRNRRAIS